LRNTEPFDRFTPEFWNMPMTHKERVLRSLDRKPVDRLPWSDSLWPETRAKYMAAGKLKEDEDPIVHFDMSWRRAGMFAGVADLDFQETILEETDDSKLVLNGNGSSLRWWKHHSGTPEHVDFKVKERSA